MSAAFDQGAISAQRRTPIAPEETWYDVTQRLSVLTQEILAEQVPLLRRREVRATPQDESSATKFSRRRPDDGVFNWDTPVLEIYNLVRAVVAPLPGATSDLGQQFDRWTSLPELVGLKHMHRPDLRPKVGGKPLTAVVDRTDGSRDRETANRQLRLRVGTTAEELRLRIDWARRRCEVNAGLGPAAREALRTFADAEIGWPVVTGPGVG